jgi:hypothetical protein
LIQQLERMLRMEKVFLKIQTRLIIGVNEDDILLDDRTGWIHEVACEIIASWLGSE